MAGEGEVLSLLGLESSLEMQETCLQGPGHPPFGPWNNFFRSLVYYHSRKHCSVQANVVLEKKLRVLHLDPQAAEGNGVPAILGIA